MRIVFICLILIAADFDVCFAADEPFPWGCLDVWRYRPVSEWWMVIPEDAQSDILLLWTLDIRNCSLDILNHPVRYWNGPVQDLLEGMPQKVIQYINVRIERARAAVGDCCPK